LNSTEQNTYAALDLIPSIVFVLDRAGQIKYVNRYTENFFNVGLDELLGQSFDSICNIYGQPEKIPFDQLNGSVENVADWNINGKSHLIQYTATSQNEGVVIYGNVTTSQESDKIDHSDLYRDFFEHSPDPMLIIDKNYEVVSCNLATAAKFGAPKEKIEGHRLDDIFDEEVNDNLRVCLDKFMEDGVCENCEIVIRRPGSDYRYFSVSGTSIQDKANDMIYGRLIWRDITEQKFVEQVHEVLYLISRASQNKSLDLYALCELVHKQLQKVIEASNFYISIYDKDENRITFPYVKDEYMHEKEAAYDDRPFSDGLTERVIKEGQPILINDKLRENIHQHKIGKYFGTVAESWLGVPLKMKGEVFGVLAVQSFTVKNAYTREDLELLEFVSDQVSRSVYWQQTQSKIEEVFKLNKRVIETSDQVFYVVKVTEGDLISNQLSYLSPQVENVFGVSVQDFLANPGIWFESIHPDDVRSLVDREEELKKGKSTTREYRVKNARTGKYVWLEDDVVAVTDNNSNIVEMYGAARDITARKLSEHALRRSRKRYINFIRNSTEGIWRIVFSTPINTKDPVKKQVDKILYEGQIAECNNRLAQIYGHKEARDMQGLNVIDLLNLKSKDELTHMKNLIAAFIKNGYVAENVVSKLRKPDNNWIYISTSTKATKSDGLIDEFWGVQQDVTKEVMTSKRLEQSYSELKFIDQINVSSIKGASLKQMAKVIAKSYQQFSNNFSAFRFLSFNDLKEDLELVHEDITMELKQQIIHKNVKLSELTPQFKERSAFYEVIKNAEIIVTKYDSSEEEPEINVSNEKLATYVSWAKWIQGLLGIRTLMLIPLVAQDRTFGLMNLAFDQKVGDKEIESIKRFTNGIMTAIVKSYTENKIEEQRKFNDFILNNIPVDIAVFDKAQKYRFLNKSAVKDDEMRAWLIGKTDHDYCEKKGASRDLGLRREFAFNRALDSKLAASWIDTHPTKDGEDKFMLRRLEPFYDNKKLKYVIGYGIDISEQKKLEKLLFLLTNIQKRFILKGTEINIFEELLGMFLDLTKSDSGFIATKNIKGDDFAIHSKTHVFWKKNLEGICKTFEEPTAGGIRVKWFGNQDKSNSLINSLNKIDKDFKISGLSKKFSNDYVFLGVGFYTQDKLRAVVGMTKYGSHYGQVDIDAINPFVTTSATLIDAYFDKLKASQIEILNRRLANVVSFSTESIVSMDLNQKVTSWNKAAEQLFGYTAEEMLGEHIGVIVPKEKQNESRDLKARIVEGDNIQNYETERLHKNGSLVEIVFSLFPLKDENGELVGFSGIARDNSEKKRLDQLRLKSILEGEETERNRIAHDLHDGLGQILTALTLNLQAVKLNIDDDVDNLMSIAKQASNEYRAVTQNLISPTLKGEGLIDSIKGICENLRNVGYNIAFTADAKGTFSKENQILLYRCAQELINNAVRHSDSEQIKVNLQRDDDKIKLSVEDNGKGFDFRNVPKKGVGLYSMRSRVQMIGGTFDLLSRKNKGTKILISIINN